MSEVDKTSSLRPWRIAFVTNISYRPDVETILFYIFRTWCYLMRMRWYLKLSTFYPFEAAIISFKYSCYADWPKLQDKFNYGKGDLVGARLYLGGNPIRVEGGVDSSGRVSKIIL